MKICFIADLHLPYHRGAVQYEVLDWFAAEMKKKKPDLIICAGDFTADGDKEAAKHFKSVLTETGIRFIITAGNSDVRTEKTKKSILSLVSPKDERFKDGIAVFNDYGARLSNGEQEHLSGGENISVAVLHHPPAALHSAARVKFAAWRALHPQAWVFYAHLHRFQVSGRDVCLPCADPDKNIGTEPSVLFFNTESGELRRDAFHCPAPPEFYDLLGITCFDPLTDIPFAARHGLKHIELRQNPCRDRRTELFEAIKSWRESGGASLSLHAPELVVKNREVANQTEWEEFCTFACQVGANRITLHVPECSVAEYPGAQPALVKHLKKISALLPEGCVIGVENLHMKPGDSTDSSRPYGYLPQEALGFMRLVKASVKNETGFNLDIGHARNNQPFSRKYTLGAWYAEVGKYAVGYHIHQVSADFENHKPFTSLNEKLISLASLFRCLQNGTLAKAPMILEIRHGEYRKCIELFESEKNAPVFDMHSHTNFSACGRDEPEELIETAIANGVKILGITDHSYGVGARKAEYLALQHSLKKKYSDRIKIVCGIEIPTVDTHFDIDDPAQIAGFDYALIEHVDRDNSVAKEDFFAFIEKMGIPCGIAHTDLFGYCAARGTEPAGLFGKMAERNIFWELNVSCDSVHAYREHAYVKEFMASEEQQRIVKNSGVMLTVGFDSHRAADYDGEKVYEACRFLQDKGFNIYKG